MAALFDLEAMVATSGALELLTSTATKPAELLWRHASGDWGETPSEDTRENARSLKYGWRVLSSYAVGESRVWIITESDRSATTLLLSSDY